MKVCAPGERPFPRNHAFNIIAKPLQVLHSQFNKWKEEGFQLICVNIPFWPLNYDNLIIENDGNSERFSKAIMLLVGQGDSHF